MGGALGAAEHWRMKMATSTQPRGQQIKATRAGGFIAGQQRLGLELDAEHVDAILDAVTDLRVKYGSNTPAPVALFCNL